MRYYEVTIPLKGAITKTVVAEDEDSARELALSEWARSKYKGLDYLEPDDRASGHCIEGDEVDEFDG